MRLKIGSGSLAAVKHDRINSMENLSFLPLPPPTFSRCGGAEVWVQTDSCIFPHILPSWIYCRASVGK